MRYIPQRKNIEEIMLIRGFLSAERGYVKDLNEKNIRLHALPTFHDGEIILDLHLDEPDPLIKNKHISRKFCKRVKQEIKAWEKLDVSDKWYLRLWDSLKKAINKV